MTSMENWADISEAQVQPNGRNCFSPIENWIIEFIDLFVYLAEL